jgi:DNA primase
LRGLEVARQSLDRDSDPVFDTRGLLGYESRLQADIRVSTLPAGMDPDEVVAQNPGDWERLVADARPIVVHVMETLAKEFDLEDPKAKSGLAAQVLPLIEDVPDPVERDAYRQRLARLLKVDERAMLDWSPRRSSSRRGAQSRARRQSQGSRGQRVETPDSGEQFGGSLGFAVSDPVEAYCISVLLRRPDLVYHLDRALQEKGLNRLMPDDFQSADHQALLQLIEDSLIQDHAEPLHFVLNSLSLPLMELADQLLVKSEKLDPNETRVLDDLVRSILMLRQRRLRQQMDHVRYLMEEAQQSHDGRASEYHQMMTQFVVARGRLDRALGQKSG